MGKEPNTVKSNVIKGLMDFSEQDPNLELNSSDFQDEMDSTVLVRERARGAKLEQTFSKKPGKLIREKAHTITFLPESSNAPKILSERDVAVATNEQKDKIKKNEKRKKQKLWRQQQARAKVTSHQKERQRIKETPHNKTLK